VSDEEQFRFLPATIESARAYHASAMGDKRAAIEHAKKALDLVEKEDHIRRSMVETLLGLALWANGELEAAYSAIVAGITDEYMEIMVAIVLAELRIEQGRLQQACHIYEKSLRTAEAEEENFNIPLASFYLGLGKIKFLKGDLQEAEMLLQRSREQGDRAAFYNWRYNWHLLQASIKGSLGKLDEAMDSLNEAEKYYLRSPIPDIQPLYALKTRMMIRQGKRIRVADWMKENGLKVEDGLEYIREFEHVTLAKVLISEYGYSKNAKLLLEAKQLTERLLLEAQIGNRPGSAIEILLLQAIMHKAKDEMESAEKCLAEALILAEPEGYVQFFADEGLQMRQLLTASVKNKTMPGYMSKVLSAMEGKRGTIEPEGASSIEAGGASSTTAAGLMEPLSERELEILQLIAKGLTNHEICERLFLALSTVKGYNQILYGNLQVKSRTEAVARAREWDLI
jgi:LuxR family maltose regulon positive regulatory protein